jgi:hypothetical protein
MDITAEDSNWGPPILKSRNLPLDQSDPQQNLGKISFINIRIPDHFENVKCKQNNIDITAQDSNWGPPILKSRNLTLDRIDPQQNLGKISFKSLSKSEQAQSQFVRSKPQTQPTQQKSFCPTPTEAPPSTLTSQQVKTNTDVLQDLVLTVGQLAEKVEKMTTKPSQPLRQRTTYPTDGVPLEPDKKKAL